MDNVVEKSYQMVYYLQDESCAGIYTEDELAVLMTGMFGTGNDSITSNDL